MSHNMPAMVKERKLGLVKAAKEPAEASRPALAAVTIALAWQT
jgi:hypothetical protein